MEICVQDVSYTSKSGHLLRRTSSLASSIVGLLGTKNSPFRNVHVAHDQPADARSGRGDKGHRSHRCFGTSCIIRSRRHDCTRTSARAESFASAHHLRIYSLRQAAPLEDDLREWHVNLWMSPPLNAAIQTDLPLHLILHFPEDYPTTPPTVECCTPFPHSNVVRKNGSNKLTICLDMLDPPSKSGQAYAGWSSAMTVLSILLQLQSFLFSEKLQYMDGMGNMERARELMAAFECTRSGHKQGFAWPPRRDENPRPSTQRRLVCKPCGTVAVSCGNEAAPIVTAPPPTSILVAAAAGISTTIATETLTAPPMTVKQPSAEKQRGHNPFAVLMRQDSTEGALTLVAMPKAAAAGAAKSPASSAKPVADLAKAMAAPPKAALTLPSAAKGSEMTPAQKKNLQRSRRRQQRKLEPHTPAGKEKSTQHATAPPSESSESSLELEAGETSAAVALTALDCADDIDEVSTPEMAAEMATAANAGPFALLGYDAALVLMEQLHTEADVRALACTCRHMRGVCDDGLLWRILFHKHYPASQISSASLGEWKYAFMLELSCNADRLMCFHTKAELGMIDARRRRPEVFGIPITFTVNPRTHEVDYIYSSLDTLSFSAYADDGVRRTVWGEKFTHFLPLFLTHEHYEAAKPALRTSIKALVEGSPRWKHARGQYRPEMALDVLPKLLSTMVVLLVDKGVSASDTFLDGFVQIYRLLLAIAAEHPNLRTEVTRRVREFVASESKRTKDAEPNLGVLVPLLALCNGLRWCDLAWPLLEELMDRGVLWACRDHPELAEPAKLDVDEALSLAWGARTVANRLLMFSVGFLSRLSKVSVEQLDGFHGQPTPWLRASMRQHIEKVLTAKSWPEFFTLINVPLPSKAYMHAWLTRAVANSERKRYHKRGMDFSRIQRSGVSSILRKGESISASPTMKRVRLIEVWRWAGNGTLFLDASALAYSFGGSPLGHVDYSEQQSTTGLVTGGCHRIVTGGQSRVAMRHSGDVIDHAHHEGKHTIDIDLRALSDEVGAIYLTLSAWQQDLRTIVRPEVLCIDPDEKSNEPLARYELEGRPTGSQTAVLMAKIWRPAPGKSWKVTAIGELCKGRAGQYQPMHDKISGLQAD